MSLFLEQQPGTSQELLCVAPLLLLHGVLPLLLWSATPANPYTARKPLGILAGVVVVATTDDADDLRRTRSRPT